ncbi:hypothetical protein ACFPZP_16205 [Citrobacter bitternis]|uniref:ArsR family transcriptional regulator n=1 Tax=Citrobacter bitternis TaxID=1585982 RepID=A0ABW1Q2H0_9ENTR
MMDEISVEILKSIPAFAPVNTAQLVQKIGCPKRKVLDGLANLRAAGRIFTKIPVGHFSSESVYQTWLENGGKEYLACRGRAAAARSNSSKCRRHNTIPSRTITLLRNHGSLRAVEIARILDIPYNTLSGQLSTMVTRGQVIRTGMGKSLYSLAPGIELAQKSATAGNGIFAECRSSAAMQRVLSVYGVRV